MRKSQLRQTRFRGQGSQSAKSARYLTVTPDGQTQTGGLTFARNSTSTKTNADSSISSLGINEPYLDHGLKMRPATTNLLLWSEEVGAPNWSFAAGTTITSNTTIAPDGTQTADSVVGVGISSYLRHYPVTPSDGTYYTGSVWLKSNTSESVPLFLQINDVHGSIPDWTPSAGYSLSSLGQPTAHNGRYYKVTTAGTSGVTEPIWSTTPNGTVADGTVIWTEQGFINLSSGAAITVTPEWQRFSVTSNKPAEATNSIALYILDLSATSNVSVWGAQLETGSVATDYVKSEGTQGVRAAETATIQLPGLRQNFIPYSQDFSNPAWIRLSSPTITPNAALAPDGTMTADQVNASNPDGSVSTSGPNNIAADGGAYTLSVWARAVSGTQANFKIRIRDNTANGVVAFNAVNLSTNWQRVTTTLASSTAGNLLGVNIYPGGESGTGNVYLWGAQLVHGTQPLDYTPTTDATINVPSWLSTQEGSVAVTITPTWTGANPSAVTSRVISASSLGSAQFGLIGPGGAALNAYDGSHSPGVPASFVAGQPLRFACRWSKTGNFIRIDNLKSGAIGTASAFGGFPSFDAILNIGSQGASGQPNATISDICFSSDPNGAF